MSEKVTVRTGGTIVGRRNTTFDLDTVTMVLDLARRKYRVYLRGDREAADHVVMVRMVDDRLELYHTIRDQPVVPSNDGMPQPEWWNQLDSYLRHLDPVLFDNRITNQTEEASCPTP